MARGVNKVLLVGHLGKDPETRYSPDGKAVANVTIATSEQWKDKTSGEKQERTEWHRVVFFGRLAEIVDQYVKKGAQIYVEGRLQTRKWKDKEGNDRYTTEIVANEMQMLGGKGDGGERAERPDSTGPNGYQQAKGGGTGNRGAAPDFDDDIPF